MGKNIVIVLLLFFCLGSFAQGESNIWYFGLKAGLDFSSGSPVPINDGQIDTEEGCATISNASGQLLFYTDGVTVWNKNHQIMPNGTGLLGSNSSSQSAIAVPNPGSSTIYYIFTSDAAENGNSNGVRYSEVDLSLNGGLGDVTASKNIVLLAPSCEKIAAVKNASGDGYWVVIHGYANNSFLSYSITSSGINAVPVVSNVGTWLAPYIPYSNFTLGYLKFSPDGTKLISCNNNLNAELFDFNAANGSITNPRLINNYMYNYGVEFSPSGNIAYISTWHDELYQYNLTALNIPATEVVLRATGSVVNWLGALQLAIDNKIYVANFSSDHLCVINNPDVLGLGCDFQYNAIPLGSGFSILGLPQFIHSYINVAINTQNSCLGETSAFTLNANQNITSAAWDFGDGFTSTDINATHQYTSAGTYSVSLTATSPTETVTNTRSIVISAIPTAAQPQNMWACDTNNDGWYTFDLTTQNPTILNGQNPALFTVKYYANATDYANKLAIATPNSYVNAMAYQQQTIIAEVSNNANAVCKSTTAFEMDVFDTPTPNLPGNIPNLTSCDNTSVGSDDDGRVIFDLTQNATAILNGLSAADFSVLYYTDAIFTNVVVAPAMYQNTNPAETIYVKVVNKENVNCFGTTSFKIQVFPLPFISSVADLKQCDADIDGFSIFNLEEAIGKMTTIAANETIAFFKTLPEAESNTNSIVNVTAYPNQIVSNDVVFVRVTNVNGCYKVAQLNLIVTTTQIPSTFARSFTVCDDPVLGTNTDGISAFDFSGVTGQVQNIFPAGQLLDITYYSNVNDALAETNAITDISNYRNIGYPTTQNIYIRVDSKLNNDCLGLGSYITLHVEPIPIVNPIIQKHCDDNQDGLYAFNTSAIQTTLLHGLTNVTVTYFDENNQLLSSPLPNPFVTPSQTLKAVVTNNTPTACNYQTTIQFIVDDLPEAFPVPTSLTSVCDDEIDPATQDGSYAFDTLTFEASILGGQTGMMVHYFDKNNKPLSSPLPNPFVTTTQNIKAEVINPVNTSCSAVITIPFVVNSLPNIVLTGGELVCNNNPDFTKVVNAGLVNPSTKNNFTYVWYKDGTKIPSAKQYNLTVNAEGIYTAEVMSAQGCVRTRTITVTASEGATIDKLDVDDLSEENTITVWASGLGDYVYSLDNQIYQESNTFYNVNTGIYTVYVKDLNGCGTAVKEVSVLGVPKYFTPNDDGFNDFWNIKGVNAAINQKTTIYIFDRYGKLLKQISSADQGWDGFYNGKPMPSDDYWYSIELEDGRTTKGHFTLKR